MGFNLLKAANSMAYPRKSAKNRLLYKNIFTNKPVFDFFSLPKPTFTTIFRKFNALFSCAEVLRIDIF